MLLNIPLITAKAVLLVVSDLVSLNFMFKHKEVKDQYAVYLYMLLLL